MTDLGDVTMLDPVQRCRADFPLLERRMHGRPLVYLDNAATSQKPQAVLDALQHYYRELNANVHRGVYELSEQATAAYEGARDRVQRFINAAGREEIVFLRGTTEAINLVAQAWARPRLQPDDQVLISALEHHSNIVPWQIVCRQTGAQLKVIPVLDNGEIDQDAFVELLGPRVRLLALNHVSNALGTINPVEAMIAQAHEHGIPVLIDGAQAVPHLRVDVQVLDAEFYAFSGHKLYGPTGIGVLYGKRAVLEAMEPWQGGGEMISRVSYEHTEYKPSPYKFEAGTPNIADAIGLAAAIDYVDSLGLERIAEHERQLLAYGTEVLQQVPGLRLIGTARDKAAILSFVMAQAHPHDISTILDRCGVAVRAGHHCTMPLMQRFGIAGTARASMGVYNSREDIDVLVEALYEVVKVFGEPKAGEPKAGEPETEEGH